MIGRIGIVLGTLYCLNMAEAPSLTPQEAASRPVVQPWQPLAGSLELAGGLAGLCAGHGVFCQRIAVDAADHFLTQASRPQNLTLTQDKVKGMSPQPVNAPLPPRRSMMEDKQALKQLIARAI